MSKMSELSTLLDDLIECGDKLTKTAQALKDFYSDTKEVNSSPRKKPVTKEAPAATETPAEQPLKKEDVRGILAKKANEADGKYKVQVKELVKKYGNGGSLTDVATSDYAALVADIEALSDAE